MERNRYKEAGVDVNAGYKAVELMKEHIGRTFTAGTLGGIGGFSGMFIPDLKDMDEPVLVAGTDGVGTKLKLAFATGIHDTVGIDAVAMCVNDIICCGAAPLFFLDYIATGRIDPTVTASIVKGIADGCVEAGCALIGGETAEMPGFYDPYEYDLAGFAVGIVDKKKILQSGNIQVGDTVIGLASSGFHSNGFSLVRKVFDIDRLHETDLSDVLGVSLAEALMIPTRIYVKPVMALLGTGITVGGICHITGGGFYENIPRCLPEGFSAKIKKDSFTVPPVIQLLQREGEIPEADMFSTFNMGIGMIIVVKSEDTVAALSILNRNNAKAKVIGSIVRSKEGVILW